MSLNQKGDFHSTRVRSRLFNLKLKHLEKRSGGENLEL